MPRQLKITSHTRKHENMDQPKEQTNSSAETQEWRQLMLNKFDEMKEDIAKELKDIKKTLADHKEEFINLKKQMAELMGMKATMEEMKNTMEGHNSRFEQAEERISELEDRSFEFIHTKEQMVKKMEKYEQCLRELSDNMKRTNIRVMGIPEGEERGKGAERVIEDIFTENFPTLIKDRKLEIQEVQRTPNRIDPNRPTPRHLLVRLSNVKDKERILKAAREKQSITYKGKSIRLCTDFSAETMEARRQWHDIFKILKEKNCQPRILYPAKLSFKNEGEIKTFSDKQTLREFVNKRPALQEILKGVLQADRKRQEREVWRRV